MLKIKEKINFNLNKKGKNFKKIFDENSTKDKPVKKPLN